jgi:hypothetical protein
MNAKTRIKQLEKARGTDKKSGRYAIHCTTSNTVLVDGVTMTLAKWDKIKTDKDKVVTIGIDLGAL